MKKKTINHAANDLKIKELKSKGMNMLQIAEKMKVKHHYVRNRVNRMRAMENFSETVEAVEREAAKRSIAPMDAKIEETKKSGNIEIHIPFDVIAKRIAADFVTPEIIEKIIKCELQKMFPTGRDVLNG